MRRYFSTAIKTSHDTLISTEELQSLIEEKHANVSVLNATVSTEELVDPVNAHIRSRIPGSVFFDLAKLVDHESDIPFLLPKVTNFRAYMRSIDVKKDDLIVTYDMNNNFSSSRAWWMLNVFGAHNVRVLNGSFQKWNNEKRPIDKMQPDAAFRHDRFEETFKSSETDDYHYKINHNLYVQKDEVEELVFQNRKTINNIIIDSSRKEFFERGGIPSAINLFWRNIFNEDGTFKSEEELSEIFKEAGVKNPRHDHIVLTSRKSITSCALQVALSLLGNMNSRVYVGGNLEYAKKE
jgi:thiosulfate/3-mercaptopyruvate sulfurtransferase